MAERTPPFAKSRLRSVLDSDQSRPLPSTPSPASSQAVQSAAASPLSSLRPPPSYLALSVVSATSAAFTASAASASAPSSSGARSRATSRHAHPSSAATRHHIPAVASSRVTRSSARQAARQPAPTAPAKTALSASVAPAAAGDTPILTALSQPVRPPSSPAPTRSSPSAPLPPYNLRTSRSKRKARQVSDEATLQSSAPGEPLSASLQNTKRPKLAQPTPLAPPFLASTHDLPPAAFTRSRKARLSLPVMSSPESSTNLEGGPAGLPSVTRKANRGKRSALVESPTAGSSCRSRATAQGQDDGDTAMTGTDDTDSHQMFSAPSNADDGEHDDNESDEQNEDDLPGYGDDGLSNPFGSGFAPPRGSGLPTALSMLNGMLSLSGMGSRLRDILNNLRQKDDTSIQLIALQDLSEILLVSNEDNLSGGFSPDAFVHELITLMQPNELTGEENPEVMLLACRCLANLMEALPASVANVVYGGAVPVLCQKLLEISFIDLAEQALSTLEKISVEFPASIVREGGLTACLSFLEFFATSTQRTAVTTAANCCRNIPEDSFPVVRDVMPILLNVLGSNDQRVVDQAALCVSRIVESFKHYPSKLENLVGVDLLKAILRLLLPGSTNNLIGPNLHTQFLRVLAITANDSPRLAAELIKMNVVETLYQILTGVSPPSGTEEVASKLDSVLIMQSLIHRPREQVIETLNVICNLLPRETTTRTFPIVHGMAVSPASAGADEAATGTAMSVYSRKKPSSNQKRIELLHGCKDEVRRFALIIFPTLTDAYSSTVNLDVRSKVLSAQIKMLSNFDRDVIFEALKAVPYASFLASILSQQDHPLLVHFALQATELLMSRLDDVYRYQLYREGVVSEIEKIAAWEEPQQVHEFDSEYTRTDFTPASDSGDGRQYTVTSHGRENSESDSDEGDHEYDSNNDSYDQHKHGGDTHDSDVDVDLNEDADEDDEEESGHHSNEGEEDGIGQNDDDHEDMPRSPASSESSGLSAQLFSRRLLSSVPSRLQLAAYAKNFLSVHETEKNGKAMKKKATKILSQLAAVAEELSSFYLKCSADSLPLEHGPSLFRKLASFFDSDVFESATSAELLASGIVHNLEAIFSNADAKRANAAQAAFIEVFMDHSVKSRPKTATADSPTTPFSVLVHKLQDLLSRSENFEVITVHHNTFDGNHSSAASMLAKQIRLRLVAEDDSEIPRSYRNIMVSIHAIATFKTLEDYLRPRISRSDRPRSIKRDTLSRALAAMAGSTGGSLGPAGTRFAERTAQLLSGSGLLPPSTPPMLPGGSASTQSLSSLLSVTGSSVPSSSLRSTRRSSKLRAADQLSSSDPGVQASVSPDRTPGSLDRLSLRRSSRRPANSAAGPSSSQPSSLLPADMNPLADALECADEKQMSDDEDPAGSAMDAVLGDIDGELNVSTTPDPTAISMEAVAGGSISAPKNDDMQVFTSPQSPSDTNGNSRLSALTAALQSSASVPSVSGSQGPSSYATAVQALQQDWHIEFTLNNRVLPMNSTVYGAVLTSLAGQNDQTGRPIWSSTHTVHYRRLAGPKPPEPIGFGSLPEVLETGSAHGPLDKNSNCASILRLLKILHDLNANIDDVLAENKDKDTLRLNAEPLSQFVNTKLTAKLNRQLEEPLIVASNCLPDWSEDLARLYPFLFPFETRHLFLQSTSFGYARSMARWQSAQGSDDSRRDRRDDRPYLGRLQRQKVRISRSKILESAVKVMELYGASQSILEVEYFEEVGTGLGPTLEFYSTVSREFAKRKLKLWRDGDMTDCEFVSDPSGLFPRPMSDEDAASTNGERILGLFRALGKFVARSMLDSRIIDVHFNPIFFRIGDDKSGIRPSLGAVKLVDPALARSLLLIKKFVLARKEIDEDSCLTAVEKASRAQSVVIDNTRIEDLALDFTLPGHPEIELIPNGSQESVSIDNVDLYIERVIAMTLGSGVRRQVDAFRKGFSQVFPYSALSAFTPDELVSLFGQVDEDWSLETLMDSVKADHGFNMDSRSVKNLLQVMSEMSPRERREFLQFATGSPKLPIGGFRRLTPMFTVVCKPSEAPYASDDYLPSVMTCANYLKLPDYTNIDVLRKQLYTAIKEGQGAFHLS